jgi:hypothetical protein
MKSKLQAQITCSCLFVNVQFIIIICHTNGVYNYRKLLCVSETSQYKKMSNYRWEEASNADCLVISQWHYNYYLDKTKQGTAMSCGPIKQRLRGPGFNLFIQKCYLHINLGSHMDKTRTVLYTDTRIRYVYYLHNTYTGLAYT